MNLRQNLEKTLFELENSFFQNTGLKSNNLKKIFIQFSYLFT